MAVERLSTRVATKPPTYPLNIDLRTCTWVEPHQQRKCFAARQDPQFAAQNASLGHAASAAPASATLATMRDPPSKPKTLKLEIRGQVQGVGLRWSLCAEARRLDLVGWVRNRRDGSVEALASGSADAIERLVAWARTGPAAARVSSVDAVEAFDAEGSFSDFEQRPSV